MCPVWTAATAIHHTLWISTIGRANSNYSPLVMARASMVFKPKSISVMWCVPTVIASAHTSVERKPVTTERILLLPDSQFGSEDRKLHRLFVSEVIPDIEPDVLVHVGDFLDCKAPARWSKGTADEFASTLQKEVDRGRAWLEDIRRIYDGPFHLRLGNHDERIDTYLRTQAPALASLRALRFEELLGLSALEITLQPQPFKVAPGWVVAHGHEGTLSKQAGQTAMGLARKFGVSVVCGHTHRLGLAHETSGYNGSQNALWGMEVGHAMDIRKAAYLEGGAASWQQGFGVLERVGNRVFPRVYPVIRGEW